MSMFMPGHATVIKVTKTPFQDILGWVRPAWGRIHLGQFDARVAQLEGKGSQACLVGPRHASKKGRSLFYVEDLAQLNDEIVRAEPYLTPRVLIYRDTGIRDPFTQKEVIDFTVAHIVDDRAGSFCIYARTLAWYEHLRDAFAEKGQQERLHAQLVCADDIPKGMRYWGCDPKEIQLVWHDLRGLVEDIAEKT